MAVRPDISNASAFDSAKKLLIQFNAEYPLVGDLRVNFLARGLLAMAPVCGSPDESWSAIPRNLLEDATGTVRDLF